MRWVFYALLIINLAYGGWKLTFWMMQPAASATPAVVQEQLPQAPLTLQVVAASLPLTAAVPATPVSASNALCTSLGPWQDAAAANQAKADLGALAAGANVASVSVQKQGLNWVYLPSFATRDEALAVLKQLQGQGVDSFITADGASQNAISLGFFGSHDSALGLQQRMQQAGFNAQVRETAHDITEYWLYLAAVKEGALAAWLDQHKDVTLGKVACPAAASSNLINLQAPDK